jgi:dihydrofolate reductase
VVQADVEGDTYFPIRSFEDFDWNSWVLLEQEPHDADEKNEFPYVFTVWQRCEPKI